MLTYFLNNLCAIRKYVWSCDWCAIRELRIEFELIIFFTWFKFTRAISKCPDSCSLTVKTPMPSVLYAHLTRFSLCFSWNALSQNMINCTLKLNKLRNTLRINWYHRTIFEWTCELLLCKKMRKWWQCYRTIFGFTRAPLLCK